MILPSGQRASEQTDFLVGLCNFIPKSADVTAYRVEYFNLHKLGKRGRPRSGLLFTIGFSRNASPCPFGFLGMIGGECLRCGKPVSKVLAGGFGSVTIAPGGKQAIEDLFLGCACAGKRHKKTAAGLLAQPHQALRVKHKREH